jgi:hypothetical protein
LEIDYNYQKGKKFIKGKFLPHIIYGEPFFKQKEEILSQKNFYYIFNNKSIKHFKATNKEIYKMNMYIYFGISTFFGIFLPIVFSINNRKVLDLWVFLILLSISVSFFIFFFLYLQKYKITPEKAHIYFDRIKGLITMPKIGDCEYFTIPFDHLKATRMAYGTQHSYSGQQLYFYRDVKTRTLFNAHSDDSIMMSLPPKEPKIVWSFYVWYMDKNRPLPPGTAFDDFREEDFNRRKADGFPPPLYKSLINTPEATEQQQTLRENYWKDEDFIATEKEAFFSLLKKNDVLGRIKNK